MREIRVLQHSEHMELLDLVVCVQSSYRISICCFGIGYEPMNQSSSSFCTVSPRDDQPHIEVGGCMEGAGLPGSKCFLRRARREWTLTEICPLGTTWSLFPPPTAPSFRFLV